MITGKYVLASEKRLSHATCLRLLAHTGLRLLVKYERLVSLIDSRQVVMNVVRDKSSGYV